MGSGEQAPHQGSALSAQLAKLAKPGAAAFRIICNNLKQQQCSVRNTMEEVQVNGSYRSVIKVNGDAEENYLFPAHLLEKLQDVDIKQVPSLPPLESSLLVRPLRLSDFDTGFLALLAQLTSVGEITRQQWEERWKELKSSSGYFIVVSDEYRGRQLGKLLVSSCSLLAKRLDCYKVTLNCADKMVKFYNSLGYSCEQGNANYLCIRLDK